MELGNGLTVTWLGHAAFEITAEDGRVILIDPWLENPKAPERAKQLERVDLVLVTHGHFDHVGNAVDVAKKHGAKVIAIYEVAVWLQGQGVPESQVMMMNKGGTIDVDGLRVTMVEAQHSSGLTGESGLVPGGASAGYVVRFPNGFSLYHAGDTNVFGDMKIIGELYQPRLALLPIGGHFTMGPVEAAYAAKLLNVPAVLPMHYGTFPVLTGTPDQLRQESGGSFEVVALEPGGTLR